MSSSQLFLCVKEFSPCKGSAIGLRAYYTTPAKGCVIHRWRGGKGRHEGKEDCCASVHEKDCTQRTQRSFAVNAKWKRHDLATETRKFTEKRNPCLAKGHAALRFYHKGTQRGSRKRLRCASVQTIPHVRDTQGEEGPSDRLRTGRSHITKQQRKAFARAQQWLGRHRIKDMREKTLAPVGAALILLECQQIGSTISTTHIGELDPGS